jgi:PAS domain S-box-containing protein
MERHAWDLSTVERRLAIATEAARIGLWDWNVVTGEMIYSRRAKLICGFDPDGSVTLDMVRAVTHPDDLPHTWAMSVRAMDPAIRAYEPYRYRIVRADNGEVRWVLAYGQATFDGPGPAGRCLAYTGTIQDITEQKLSEDQVTESETRLRLALEAGDMAVWEVDIVAGTVTHSPMLNMLCGFPPDSTPSVAEFQAHYAPGELERIQDLAAEIRARGETRMEAELRLIWPDGTPKWVRLRAQEAPGSGGQRVIGVLYDITDRKHAEERTELIARELRHRLKNSLAVLQTIAAQSIRGHANPEDGLAALNGRLVALSAAAGAVSEADWENTSIIGLVERVLAPHHDGHRAGRFDCDGPDIPLPAGFASTLALALHELATNAGKYGALSVPGGKVSMTWDFEENRRFTLTWIEAGGPEVPLPSRSGFGTRMIERALFTAFSGHAALTYWPQGLQCRIVATIP